MSVKLVVARGVHEGTVIAITGPQFLIGRLSRCHLRAASLLVSRRHCVLYLNDGDLTVCDLNSTNGTFVNGQRVEGELELQHGDRLKVGPLVFIVQMEHSAALEERPPFPVSTGAAWEFEEDQAANMLLQLDESVDFQLINEDEVEASTLTDQPVEADSIR